MLQVSTKNERLCATRVDRLLKLGKTWARFALAVLVLFGATYSTFGQTGQGSINGKVTDPDGRALPDVTVTATNNDSQVTLTTHTNKSGEYNIQSLNPADYTITADHAGFQQMIQTKVAISAGGVSEINFKMKIGKESQSVTVTADDALLTKDSSDVVTTVDHQLVEDLPYPERSSLEAVLLVPGVNGDPLQPGGISTENPNYTIGVTTPGGSLRVGGAPPGTSSILVDGSDVTQGSYPRTGVNLSGRLVGQTSAVVTGMAAHYGRSGGGIVIQTSRPGTNEYHGALTYRHTDPFFQAYPLGLAAPADEHENYYGAYVGGPVWIPKIYNGHRRTFFYVGVEPARIRNFVANRGAIQLPEELTGQFHNSLTVINSTILKASGYAAALAAPRTGGIYNPEQTCATYVPTNAVPLSPQCATGNIGIVPYGVPATASATQYFGPAADCASSPFNSVPAGAPCPDDVGPVLALNPFALFVNSLYPSPASPGPYVQFDNPLASYDTNGQNARVFRGVYNTDERYSVRIDHVIGDRDQVFGRYTIIPVKAARFGTLGVTNPAVSVPSTNAITHNVALGYTHVFSNSIVSVGHFSFLRVLQPTQPVAAAQTEDFGAAYGLTPSQSGFGFPGFQQSAVNGSAYSVALGLSSGQTTIVDMNYSGGVDTTYTRGNHLFQFGFDMRRILSNQYDNNGQNGGVYTLNATPTTNGNGLSGNSLASLDVGSISGFKNNPLQIPGYYRWHYYAGYFQDDWRASAKLTINAGLRYEVETPRMEANNNQGFIQLIPGTVNGFQVHSAFCFADGCGRRKTLWPMNWYGIEPRLGIAYAATQRTTVRAAYTLSRLPLTGYSAVPDPDFNTNLVTVGSSSGGVIPNAQVNILSNPVNPAGLTSGYTALLGSRGPFYTLPGIVPSYVDQSNAVPYTQQWALTLQYQPFTKTLVQATYLGLKGTHLIGKFDPSSSNPGQNLNTISAATAMQLTQQHIYTTLAVPNPLGITNGTPGSAAVQTEQKIQSYYPYQNFFAFNIPIEYPRSGTSEYEAMYISVNQRFGRGLSFIAQYQWYKSMDNVPNAVGGTSGGFGSSSPQNPFDPRSDWAVSQYDQPSVLRVGYTYALPLGQGRRFFSNHYIINQLIGNITTAGIMTSASGFPNYVSLNDNGYFESFTPSGTNGCTATGTTTTASGVTVPVKYCVSATLPPGYTVRPSRVPGVPLLHPSSVWKVNAFSNFPNVPNTPYINPAAFTVPGSLNNPQFGNASRTLTDARSPREFLFDAQLRKGVTFKRYQFNVYAVGSNILNHPVYYGINHNLYSLAANTGTGTESFTQTANFGTFVSGQSASVSRVVRIGAEFVF